MFLDRYCFLGIHAANEYVCLLAWLLLFGKERMSFMHLGMPHVVVNIDKTKLNFPPTSIVVLTL